MPKLHLTKQLVMTSIPWLVLGLGCGDVEQNAASDAVAVASSALTGAPTRAVILVDGRLYSLLKSQIDEYRALAERRRGFSIDLQAITGLDDWHFEGVHAYVAGQRASNPALEGVLFMGNIKIPSFYKVREDTLNRRIWPAYYEDLDATFTKHYADTDLDPKCSETSGPYCAIDPLVDDSGQPVPVGPHDYDGIAKGPNPDPELWAAYMPVGVSGTQNTYTDFANQLRPYLAKLISFYKLQLATNGRYYHVTSGGLDNDFEVTWNAFGRGALDVYGKAGPNGEIDDACFSGSQNLCYQRWPTESYANYAAFQAAYTSPGDGYQSPSILTQHLNASRYDVVDYTRHSQDTASIVTATAAKSITKAGLIVTLGGCQVAGLAQPFSLSGVDDPNTSASDNVMLSYLYGASSALAVVGAPQSRGTEPQFSVMFDSLKTGRQYVGKAHNARMKAQYAAAGSDSFFLREKANEALYGDPFADLGWYEGFEDGTARWTPVAGSWSIVTDGSKAYKQSNNAVQATSVAGEPSWTTQRIEAKVKAVSFNGSDRFVALLGRYGNASNTYQLALRSSNRVELRKAVNGTWTTLATATFTVSTNRWYTLKFELVGTSLKGYVDGVQKVSATDSSRMTGTAGLSSYYAVGEFDDVKISP